MTKLLWLPEASLFATEALLWSLRYVFRELIQMSSQKVLYSKRACSKHRLVMETVVFTNATKHQPQRLLLRDAVLFSLCIHLSYASETFKVFV